MSFASDLYTIMVGDSSINAEINGGINYENLPDNFDLAKKWILYYFNRTEQIDCMTIKDAYTNYTITVILITQDTDDLTNISDMVIDYLNGNDYGNILDINFSGDAHTFDREKNIYMNQLTFNAIYS